MRLTKRPLPPEKRVKITVAELNANVHIRSKCITIYEATFEEVFTMVKDLIKRRSHK